MIDLAETASLMKRLRPHRRPQLLYHYTSGSGLIGIIYSKSLWATSIRYLNDSTEYDLALDLARTSMRARLKASRSRWEEGLYIALSEELTGTAPADVYVTSFSENHDQLSQWRAYCPSS